MKTINLRNLEFHRRLAAKYIQTKSGNTICSPRLYHLRWKFLTHVTYRTKITNINHVTNVFKLAKHISVTNVIDAAKSGGIINLTSVNLNSLIFRNIYQQPVKNTWKTFEGIEPPRPGTVNLTRRFEFPVNKIFKVARRPRSDLHHKKPEVKTNRIHEKLFQNSILKPGPILHPEGQKDRYHYSHSYHSDYNHYSHHLRGSHHYAQLTAAAVRHSIPVTQQFGPFRSLQQQLKKIHIDVQTKKNTFKQKNEREVNQNKERENRKQRVNELMELSLKNRSQEAIKVFSHWSVVKIFNRDNRIENSQIEIRKNRFGAVNIHSPGLTRAVAVSAREAQSSTILTGTSQAQEEQHQTTDNQRGRSGKSEAVILYHAKAPVPNAAVAANRTKAVKTGGKSLATIPAETKTPYPTHAFTAKKTNTQGNRGKYPGSEQGIDLEQLTQQVALMLERKIIVEKERRGW
jgi:hypothetical protein